MIPDEECEEMTIEIHKKDNIVICKGCGEKKRNNTIMKHLKHPQVSCIQSYTQMDLMQLKSNSKLCQNEQISEYKRTEIIKKNLETQIQKLVTTFDYFILNLEKMYDALMIYLCHMSWQRKRWIGLWADNLNEAKLKFLNADDVTEDIAVLKTILEAEISETYYHLKTEIDTEIGPYITHDGSENAYLGHTFDEYSEDYIHLDYCIVYNIMDNTIEQKRSTHSIQYEAMSLLHYMEWRLQNSLELIVEKIKSMAHGITEQMPNSNKDIFNWFLKTLKETILEPYETLAKGDIHIRKPPHLVGILGIDFNDFL